MKIKSQKSIEITAIPETFFLVKKIRIRLLVMAGCCVFILFILQPGLLLGTEENSIVALVTVSIFLVCLVDIFFIFLDYQKAKRLDNHGTLALVLLRKKYQAKVYVDTRNRLGGRNMDFFFLEYELPNGVCIKSAVSREIFETVSEGDRLRVFYLEESPTIQRVEQRNTE